MFHLLSHPEDRDQVSGGVQVDDERASEKAAEHQLRVEGPGEATVRARRVRIRDGMTDGEMEGWKDRRSVRWGI